MDRVEFLNSISYRDDSERRSMLECFWDQYMVLYTLVDNIEYCEVVPSELSGGDIVFNLKYSDSSNVDKLATMVEANSMIMIYGKWHRIEYSRPVDSHEILICIHA